MVRLFSLICSPALFVVFFSWIFSFCTQFLEQWTFQSTANLLDLSFFSFWKVPHWTLFNSWHSSFKKKKKLFNIINSWHPSLKLIAELLDILPLWSNYSTNSGHGSPFDSRYSRYRSLFEAAKVQVVNLVSHLRVEIVALVPHLKGFSWHRE